MHDKREKDGEVGEKAEGCEEKTEIRDTAGRRDKMKYGEEMMERGW